MRILIALCVGGLLAGCVAQAAYDVATLPVRAVSQGVDWATTSQSEADRNRGRKIRKQEERERKEARKREKEERKRQRDAD